MVSAGSPAMFMHRIFSQLSDCNVTIVAPYGNDFSHYIGMKRFYPESPLAIDTMIYENTVIDGKRTQRCLNFQSASPIAIDDQIKNMIVQADAICIAPLTPNFPVSYIKEIASLKKWQTTLTLLPQGYFRQIDTENAVHVREFSEAKDIIPLMDSVIISDADHSQAATLATSWAALSDANIVMTQAERGATLFSGTTVTEIPTERVRQENIKSSIGAGDIFSAGYMYSFSKSKDATKAVAFGNALAGQCLAFAPDSIQIDLTKLP